MRQDLANGYCAEALVEAFLHAALIPPWKPSGDYETYDFAVFMNEVAVRIQVKCVSPKRRVDMRNSKDKKNNNSASKDFDVLAAVDVNNKHVYFIPMSKLEEYKSTFNVDKFNYWRENINGLVEASKEVRDNICSNYNNNINTHYVHTTTICNDRSNDDNYGILHHQ